MWEDGPVSRCALARCPGTTPKLQGPCLREGIGDGLGGWSLGNGQPKLVPKPDHLSQTGLNLLLRHRSRWVVHEASFLLPVLVEHTFGSSSVVRVGVVACDLAPS